MEIAFEPLRCTKELILRKVSEEELMEYYLGVKVQKGLFRSPLRTDKTPTCSFYRNKNGDLIYKDFGCPEHCGNFISVVMIKYNCCYAKAMQIIGNDFGILSRQDIVKHTAELEYTGSKLEQQKEAIIQVEVRDFQDYELKWWKSYGISKDTLKKFNVYSCKNVWLNGNLFHLESANQHIYGYYGGKRNDVDTWRLYMPGKKKYKFLSNWKSTQIQGSCMVPKEGGDLIVIQKSLKDAMLMYEYGITSIAPNSENTLLTEATINKLRQKFKHIVCIFDNDEPGFSYMERMKSKYPDLNYYTIDKDTGCKDFTDFYKDNGKDKTRDLIKQMLNSFNICLNVKELEPTIETEVTEPNSK